MELFDAYRYWCMVIRICRKLDLNLLHTSIFRKLFDAGKSWVHLVTFYVQFWCSGVAVNKKFERFSQLMSLTLIHLFLNLTNCARNEYTIVKLVSHSQHICILAGFVSLKLTFWEHRDFLVLDAVLVDKCQVYIFTRSFQSSKRLDVLRSST